MCGVRDVDNNVRFFVQKIVDCDLFFERSSAQTIGSRQIHDLEYRIVIDDLPLFLFDRDGLSRPVSHMVTHPGEVIEKRRLPAVRVAGQCNGDLFHTAATQISAASSFRMAS